MHIPVLLPEVIEALQPKSRGIYIDGTVGAGGHAAAILAASAPEGQLFGIDQDSQALALARRQLAEFGERAHLLQANFRQLARLVKRHQIPPADGILLDLGVSSMQLEQPERGFSFQADGPLDMRMNSEAKKSAIELVNQLPETDLANLIYQFGEEPHSRRIARAIVKARPLTKTTQLARLISQIVPNRGRRQRKIHPATRTFQALRVAVNDELSALEQVLPEALKQLKPKGRLAIISFNSLEDRIVKHYFRREARDCICPSEQIVCTCRHKATVNIITKKPITPSSAEIDVNPRARSAKLRVVELKES